MGDLSDDRRLFGLFVTVDGAGATGFSELADLGIHAKPVDHITGTSQAGIDAEVPRSNFCFISRLSKVHDPVVD